MIKNKIINGITVITSFGLGMLAMTKLFEISLAEYLRKNASTMNKYKDNEVLQKYYEDWKKNR